VTSENSMKAIYPSSKSRHFHSTVILFYLYIKDTCITFNP